MKYDYQSYFDKNGLAIVRLNNKYGMINEKNEVIIPIIYDNVYYFQSNGLAKVKVKLNNKYGIINEKNEIIIPIIYNYIYFFEDNGLTKVNLNKKWFYLNEYGIPNKKKLELIQDII